MGVTFLRKINLDNRSIIDTISISLILLSFALNNTQLDYFMSCFIIALS